MILTEHKDNSGNSTWVTDKGVVVPTDIATECLERFLNSERRLDESISNLESVLSGYVDKRNHQ